MGLLLKTDFVNDVTYQTPYSECYVRIETYLIRRNPAILDLKVWYWKSKEIAESNTRSLHSKITPLNGILDPYMVVNDELVKIPNRFSIPLLSIKNGVEDYDMSILNDVYTQGYTYLKEELNKIFETLTIEDL